MNLSFWPFSKKRKHARYALNVRKDIPLIDLVAILQRHTPVLSARDINKLPTNLQGYFVRVGK